MWRLVYGDWWTRLLDGMIAMIQDDKRLVRGSGPMVVRACERASERASERAMEARQFVRGEGARARACVGGRARRFLGMEGWNGQGATVRSGRER